jgi:hypothetical protein
MGSGAYSVFIDSPAGGGPSGGVGRRVVPLPPPGNSGGVEFSTVVLSLAYDDFGQGPATANAHVRILRGGGQLPKVFDVNVPVGRNPIATLQPNDQAASITTKPVGQGQLPAVTALVEYTTP